jgi:PLP dependent protein
MIMKTIAHNLQAVQARIARACAEAGRAVESVQLLAVSKTKPNAQLIEAYEAGQRAFGENYVQEGVEKVNSLRDACALASWHFIGPLQSNKTRVVAESFDWVHGIDRLKIAERLSEQRPKHLAPLNVCIQVNVSGEASKSGVTPAEVAALARSVSALPQVRLRGLMAIPEPAAGFAEQRVPFAQLRELLAQLQRGGLVLDTLSMGMTSDLEAAIVEGATIVRIGTAIFGERAK